MEGKMEQHIREKLHDREIQPSVSAWERLSSQLDDAESKKKRHWFFYVGYAASVIILISLVVLLSRGSENESAIPENIIVNDDLEKPQIDNTQEFISIPNKEVIVNNELDYKEPVITEKVKTDFKKSIPKSTPVLQETNEKIEVANNNKNDDFKIDVRKKIKELSHPQETVIVSNDSTRKSGRISVDSDALLMSVTSTKEELRAYYKKYKIDRADVLLAIQKELKKSNVKVNPETILAEVELEVNEENFQNNFYQFIKKRVSTVATAIANRNN